MRIRRFTRLQRLFHVLLMLTFMVQATTGLGRLYIETAWGRSVAGLFGGYTGCLAVHKWVGGVMLILFGLHVLYALWIIASGRSRGQDTLLPRVSDAKQFLRHTGWILGLCAEPRFDRWTWWEKFDYWAVFWGMVVLGGAGLILIDPLASSPVMAGGGLDVALWVPRIEAVLAIAHVVLIHFFVAHLRRTHFPMDKAMFEGSVPLAEAEAERPAWVERLRGEGRLDIQGGAGAQGIVRAVYFVFGYAVVVCGVVLVVYGLLNARLVTW